MAGGTPSLGLLTRFFFLTYLLMLYTTNVTGTEFSKQMVSEWANLVGKHAYHFTKNITSGEDLQSSYENLNVSTSEVKWRPLLDWTKTNMESYFHNKIESLKNIVNKAEDAYCKHEYNRNIGSVDVNYPNAKALSAYLNKSNIALTTSSTFNKDVTFNTSVIHVPTDVYDGSDKILNGMKWSEALDETFAKNRKDDPTMAWQYFGHDDGFMRIYPGSKWNIQQGQVDLFDARKRSWYIQGATSPKDVIIMIDASGSMRGVPMRIAKLSAMALIDTFEDNDFFNVVSFNITQKVLLCEDKLLQATKTNKEIAKKLVETIVDGNMAVWREGIKKAFDLLEKAKKARGGSDCQQAVMAFSDGTTNSLEDLFDTINPDKKVRVFTYPVGPPAESTTAMLKMSRHNRGYFSRIQSVGAVRIVSESYIRVMSRPMAMAPKANTTDSVIWTGVYLDAVGLGMVVTGTLPVFYRPTVTKNCSTALKSENDHLLGVVGTDIPLRNLKEFVLQPQIGPNGYAFGINNNGLVAFHPRLKTVYGYLPDAPGVDVMDVEIPLNASFLEELRGAMINKTFTSKNSGQGSASFDVYDVSTDELRVVKRKFNFYFESLRNTPFSFGIATPKMGFKYNPDNATGHLDKLDDLLEKSDIKLEKWPYCPGTLTSDDPLQVLRSRNLKQHRSDCNYDMLVGLSVDLQATDGLNSRWNSLKTKYNSNSVKSVFTRTNFGVTRTYSANNEEPYRPSDADFGRAAGEDVQSNTIIYSSPYYNGKKNRNSTTVRAFEKLAYDGRSAAVAGFQMDATVFADMLFEQTKKCTSGKCADTNCDRQGKHDAEGLYCYLLDENAFVVAANDGKSSGLFFGKVDNSVMEKLIDAHGNETTGVYKSVVFTDYQAITETKSGTGSSGTTLLDPLFQLTSLVDWWRSKVFVFFLYFNIFSLFSPQSVPFAEAAEDQPKNQSCIKNLTTYYTEKKNFVEYGTSDCPSADCSRNFIVASVPYSNLHLVVVDAKCGQCKDGYLAQGIPGEAPVLPDNVDNDTPCKTALYRKRPSRCFATTNPESGYPAGRGSTLAPCITVLTGILLLTISIIRDST